MRTKLHQNMGYSTDERKWWHQHRTSARKLLGSGGLFNNYSAVGSSFWYVAQWHLSQARYLGR
jgi:hypothetical protein